VIMFVIWEISLVPLSILFLEYNNIKMKQKKKKVSFWDLLTPLKIILRSYLNPITLPVICGFLLNIFFYYTKIGIRSNISIIFGNFFGILGKTSIGLALFSLGMSMYGKQFFGESITVTLVLIILKQIVNPLVCYLLNKIPIALGVVYSDSLERAGYLINMLPPAQVIYLLSVKYNVGYTEVTSTSLLGSLLSFPIIFISMSFFSFSIDQIFIPMSYVGRDDVKTTLKYRFHLYYKGSEYLWQYVVYLAIFGSYYQHFSIKNTEDQQEDLWYTCQYPKYLHPFFLY
jgi:predicted permease